MSCLWSWCRRGHKTNTDDKRTEERTQNTKKKRGKSMIEWRKDKKQDRNVKEGEKDVQIGQQATKVEDEVNVSPETPEITAPPPQQKLSGETEAPIKDLMEMMQNDVTEQLLKNEMSTVMMMADEVEEKDVKDLMNISLENSEGSMEEPLAEEQQFNQNNSEVLEMLSEETAGGAGSDQCLAENETLSPGEPDDDAIRALVEISMDDAATSHSTSLESESGAEQEKVTATETVTYRHLGKSDRHFGPDKMMTTAQVISAAETVRYLWTRVYLKEVEGEEVKIPLVYREAASAMLEILLQELATAADQPLMNKVLKIMRILPQYADLGELFETLLHHVRTSNGIALGTEVHMEVDADPEEVELFNIMFPRLDDTYKYLVDEITTTLVMKLAADDLRDLMESEKNQREAAEKPVSCEDPMEVVISETLQKLVEELVTERDQLLVNEILRTMTSEPEYEGLAKLLELLLNDVAAQWAYSETETTGQLQFTDLEEIKQTGIHPLAGDELQTVEDAEEQALTAEENCVLNELVADNERLQAEMDDLRSRSGTGSRKKTRRGTRGKGRKIKYKQENKALKTLNDDIRAPAVEQQQRNREQSVVTVKHAEQKVTRRDRR